MINLERHVKKLQDAIGVKNCADKIDEDLWWNTVIYELNQASIECPDELHEETGQRYASMLPMVRY